MEYTSQIKTSVKKSSTIPNTSTIISYLVGSDSDENFTVNSVQELTFAYTKGTFDSFGFDLEASGFTLANVSSIKAFVFNDDSIKYNMNDVRFLVELGATSIGEMSQFDMSNLSGLTDTIKITGIASDNTLIDDDKVIVNVVIAIK